MSYESRLDTLFVRNANATKTFTFPKGSDGLFADDGWFGCMNPQKQLIVVNLKTGKQRIVENVVQYGFSADGKLLVVLNSKGALTIGKPDASATESIQSVTNYYFNQAKTAMVYTIAKEKSSLHYCPLDGNREHFKMLANEAGCTFENILWDKSGTYFSFVKKYTDADDIRNGRNLNLYSLAISKSYLFDANHHPEIWKESTITFLSQNRFSISADGKRVFFYMTDKPDASLDNPTAQIWNGNDVWTYRQVEVEGRFDMAPKCFVWFPDTSKILKLTDNQQPKILLSGDTDFAITYNPAGVSPQFTQLNKTDWFITDLATGIKNSFLEDQLCDMDEIVPSPGGKYITYLKAKHWWVYEIRTGKHWNVTQNIPWPIVNEAYDYAGQKPAFGIVGWTVRDSEIIVYDEFDLWAIDLQNLRCRKLTSGREKQIRFRLTYPLDTEGFVSNLDGHFNQIIDLNAIQYLKASSKITKKTGFYIWNGKEKPLLYADKNITQLGFTKKSKSFFCKVQDYDESPSVVSITMPGRIKTVATTNDHQKNYYWGESKLINYKNSKGELLQAALYYPGNYDASKKYPMVVHIYDKLSQNLHDYVNPSLYNPSGINISNLSTQGYFVLEPDIAFEHDNVGASAADCVISATKTVISSGLVQNDRIALQGHSFAGFEVSFIATQTSIFATVIAGAGISDVVMNYNSLGWNSGKAEAWRFEDQQWRMTKPFYENKEVYLRNSPILQADKITSPMLIWTGEQDRQVHYFQSIQLYNALRRLGKKEIMLIYPEIRHNLTIPKYQIDFTRKYEEWLAYYLKGVPPAEWMKKGIN
ncbi:MAG: prolyl oligopeptidase family serine peptidase [Flavobacterium sp. JAD_PAG50586_2]|nr:MAG: prolyl oligopeptidase family serine peptidase [Flavobacterium sp. JAD_PAG50586_2]